MFEKRYTLLRSQKKRVYDILQKAGLEPAEFFWTKETVAGSLTVSRLGYRAGKYYFQFSSNEMNSWCVVCPGTFRTMDYHYPQNWDQQEKLLQEWARTLRKELDSPDPWAEMEKYRLTFDGETGTMMVNEPISAVEADEIGQMMIRLGDRLTRDLALDSEQERIVRDRCGYLAEAARRQRGRDWAFTVLGACTTMAMALSPTEEQLATLWEIVRSELKGFVRLQPVATPAATRGSRILGILSRKHSDGTPQSAEQPSDGESTGIS